MTEVATYRVSPDQRVEAMYAQFYEHVYRLHSHDAYSFGVTEAGAQAFRCRGEQRVSAAGMVMAFNPDDPHDGHAASAVGYEYRMLHVSEHLVADALGDATGHRSLPLFTDPVVVDPPLADAVRALHVAVLDGDSLAYDECMLRLVVAMVRRRATRGVDVRPAASSYLAERARARLMDDPDVAAEDLAAGCSRYALYRAFRATYGMSPSQYRRQVKLRIAKTMIADGNGLADVAVAAGFADQSHLTRTFVEAYGITPGTYRFAQPDAAGRYSARRGTSSLAPS